MELSHAKGDCMVFASDIDLTLYPSSDGKPMAASDIHYEWITTIKENLVRLFASDQMVYVAADLFWYPVPQTKDKPIRKAPDVMVVFGRPKEQRESYIQHLEDNIPPQVVFEIHSKSNDTDDWDGKLEFYQRYGVEEYYCIYPDDNLLEVWLRAGTILRRADWRDVWVSPRLGITFDLTDGALRLLDPDGNLFRSFGEERQEREQAEARADRAEAENKALLEKLERMRAAGIDPDAF